MKKKLLSLLLAGAMVLSFGGCSLFTSSDDTKENDDKQQEETPVEEDFAIQMTDSYTFTDPEDLEFDGRMVLTGGESSKLISDMVNFGFTVSAMYEILYTMDDKAVREYQYFVCPDEASAAELTDYFSSSGQQVTQEGNILYAVLDEDMLEATMAMYVSLGSMTEETPEAYMDFMADFNGLTEYQQ